VQRRFLRFVKYRSEASKLPLLRYQLQLASAVEAEVHSGTAVRCELGLLLFPYEHVPNEAVNMKCIYCKSTIYFRRHNNITAYLINFNIAYIIILVTCFDSYESSSGINFQEILYILFYSSSSYNFV